MSTDAGHPAPDWDLRVPTSDELRSFIEPVQLSFAEEVSGPEVDDWIKLLEPERCLGAFAPDSELAVGGATVISVLLTIPGGQVPAAAVTGVGVRPDHRRRGVLRSLMRRQLDDVRERGEPVAALWASEGSIYPRFGYGLAAMDGYLEIQTGRTAYARALPEEGCVRIVSEAESTSLIPAIYERMREETPGAVSRSDEWWAVGVLADPEYSRRGASAKFRVVYEADGRPEGYAIYRVKSDWDHGGPKGVLEVREAVTTTPRALRGLWRYIFDVDLVRTVKVHRAPVPNPLQHLLAEPRALGLVAGDGLWLRLVDLPAALAARRYGTADSLVIDVADAFCEWNAGRWRIDTTGEPGAALAEVARTADPADLVLDTADVAAVYLGGTRAHELAAAGRVVACTPGAVARADALFAAQRSPWCVSMF
jgi:predicted acetyltransferase